MPVEADDRKESWNGRWNITLQGSFSHNWPVWERVIALLSSGQLDVRPIIGGVWPITDWHEAFEKMHKGEVVKSVLRPV